MSGAEAGSMAAQKLDVAADRADFSCRRADDRLEGDGYPFPLRAGHDRPVGPDTLIRITHRDPRILVRNARHRSASRTAAPWSWKKGCHEITMVSRILAGSR